MQWLSINRKKYLHLMFHGNLVLSMNITTLTLDSDIL